MLAEHIKSMLPALVDAVPEPIEFGQYHVVPGEAAAALAQMLPSLLQEMPEFARAREPHVLTGVDSQMVLEE